MGFENMIATMPEKKLMLLKNLVSVGVILTIAYAVLSMVGLSSPLQFFSTRAFLTCAMVLIGLSFAWKILNGGKIVIPNQQKQKVNQQLEVTTYSGSWQCPECGTFVIGDQCLGCGYVR